MICLCWYYVPCWYCTLSIAQRSHNTLTVAYLCIYVYYLGEKNLLKLNKLYIYTYIYGKFVLFQFISSYLLDNDHGFKVIDRDKNED